MGPKMTEFVYKISTLYPAKKRSYHNSRKNQEQEADKDQKGVNSEQES